MSRRAAFGIIAVAVLLAIALLFLWPGGEESKSVAESAGSDEILELLPGDIEAAAVELYFPDEDGLLSAEVRHLPFWSTPEQGARTLLTALLDGPQDPGLIAPMPTEVTLGPVHLTANNMLYVDLMSTEFARPPSTGSQMELMSVWSLVDTVVLGIPEVETVVLLWNSRQLPSFAGHVDTSLPLSADTDLIRGGG